MPTAKKRQAPRRRVRTPDTPVPRRDAAFPPTLADAPFRECVEKDSELAALRAECARKKPAWRRKAAEWAYDSSLADSIFGRMMAQVEKDPYFMPHHIDGVEAV